MSAHTDISNVYAAFLEKTENAPIEESEEKENEYFNAIVTEAIDEISKILVKIENNHYPLSSDEREYSIVHAKETIRNLQDIYYDTRLSTPEEIQQRENAMKKIHEIAKNQNEFLWKLMTNTLPNFKRAVFGDPDYLNILRDTNHTGLEYTMQHIDRLKQVSTQAYVANCMWPYDDDRDKKMRDLCMNLILTLPEVDWITAVKQFQVPAFVRAKPGDSDYQSLYRSPNVNSRNMFYICYRHILRTVEFIEYLKDGEAYSEPECANYYDICNKIHNVFEKEIEIHVRECIQTSEAYSACDKQEIRAIACYSLLTDSISKSMRDWEEKMYAEYEAIDELHSIDDESLPVEGYKKYIDWTIIDEIIMEFLKN